ncbi:MAG: hypothetical protein ACJAYU_004774 [Bradymonadia bacterium]|jgi:hypothetical protein
MAVSATNFVAEITEITGGYEGYRHRSSIGAMEPCCGTGADLTGLGGQNAPTDLAGGAFSHGDLVPTASVDQQWTFRNGGGSFTFSGRVTAQVAEVSDGRDNDYDGRVDNGLGLYSDTAACQFDDDCVSASCADIDVETRTGACASTCGADTYGLSCTPCVDCGTGTCDDGVTGDGACDCDDTGFGGLVCDACVSGHYSASCAERHDCGGNGSCNDGITGSGTCACRRGYHGTSCNFTCTDGRRNGGTAPRPPSIAVGPAMPAMERHTDSGEFGIWLARPRAPRTLQISSSRPHLGLCRGLKSARRPASRRLRHVG